MSGVMAIHVDDILFTGDHTMTSVLNNVRQRFVFGSEKRDSFVHLGIEIKSNDDHSHVTLSQETYIATLQHILHVQQMLKVGSLESSNISASACWWHHVDCRDPTFRSMHVSWQTTDRVQSCKMSSRPISCCAIFKEHQVRVWCSGSCKVQFEFWHMPTLPFRTCPMHAVKLVISS
jgi:hypothetical protein